MPQTSPSNLRYPQGSDRVNVPEDLKNLADDVQREVTRLDTEDDRIEAKIGTDVAAAITAAKPRTYADLRGS